MATVTNMEFELERNAANAELTGGYDVEFDQYDRDSNTPYEVRFRLHGIDADDDEDSEDNVDDSLRPRWIRRKPVRADGRSSVSLSFNGNEFAYDRLDEDPDGEDEVKMVITLTPLLPVAQSFETEDLLSQ